MIRCFIFVLFAAPAIAEDGPSNVNYAMWSHFKQGTTLTFRNTIDSPKHKLETKEIFTLVEKTDTKIVVEHVIVNILNGKETATPPRKQEHLRNVEGNTVAAKPIPVGPKDAVETLKVSGREYPTRIMESGTDGKAGTSKSRTWFSTEIPGLILKMETIRTGKLEGKNLRELIEVKEP
jgi:hypothetical protein